MSNRKHYETFDELMEKDKCDLEIIYPGLIEMLKEVGGGELSGLSPAFYGKCGVLQ
ncbi:hypothetical protein GCM10010913_46930 [Paenibacillus aceti]|uniref:Bacteriocin n=1 Tax=Paenibacillus aceti TaxID=1820010 RepID=A0ABQ1W8Y7_9BACL|nr:hypothetical protein GCM10010913_46930 [Paenibacillus aceti]